MSLPGFPWYVNLMPIYESRTEFIILMIYDGASNDDIYYFTGIEYIKEFFKKFGLIEVTDSVIEKEVKMGNWYYLLLTNQDLLYKKSHRPITNMKMFSDNYYDCTCEISGLKLPVARYASSVDSGKYNTERPDCMCGYFYYLENESTTFLSYKKPFKSFNKVTAAYELRKMIPKDEKRLRYDLNEGIARVDRKGTLQFQLMHAEGILPRDLRFTPEEAFDLLGVDGYIENYSSSFRAYLGGEHIGAEEFLDQPICKAAKFLGYDIVIFEALVGETQVDCEILDTRDDSFRNLWLKR